MNEHHDVTEIRLLAGNIATLLTPLSSLTIPLTPLAPPLLSPQQHMMPSEAAFAAAMDALGITNDTHVVVYDRSGIFSAPRAWFTFNVMGHSK